MDWMGGRGWLNEGKREEEVGRSTKDKKEAGQMEGDTKVWMARHCGAAQMCRSVDHF